MLSTGISYIFILYSFHLLLFLIRKVQWVVSEQHGKACLDGFHSNILLARSLGNLIVVDLEKKSLELDGFIMKPEQTKETSCGARLTETFM